MFLVTRFSQRSAFLISAFASLLAVSVCNAATFSEVEQLYRSGKLAEAEEIAAAEVERGVWNRRWSELLIRCQLDTGKYAKALETYDAALKRYPTSLPLRSLGIQVARFNALDDRVATEKAYIDRILQTGQLRYATADTLIAAGRFFSKNGIDARIILKSFYDRVLESDPSNLEALVATAELAVEKGDYRVAADTIARAKRLEVTDARLEHLLAVSLAGSDSQAARQALGQSLQANPLYGPALVLKAEKEIDGEHYEEAQQTIDAMLSINPHDPMALSLQAVLSHLDGDYEAEATWREKALEYWSTNPEVDHLIGRKLSDKYRFAEGAECQRRALTFDPDHVPATFQLAQDLLRLGDEDIGWQLADEVHQQDPYNVVAYNLMTLKDRVDGFVTIASRDAYEDPGPGILVRMDPKERSVYGDDVMALLVEARDFLADKYDLELKRPVLVEIFPKQSDFAIRTFGLPGGDGFLGVCFGHVITANSPASQGERPSNWKSVLWHEFCHVITLTKTNNRMPRWLSEGISVYEERVRDPSWGQSMTPRYREMILGDDFTRISDLSGLFLSPPTPTHLQFAYYESSLVVEFLIERHGEEALNAILDSLATGMSMNDALQSNLGSIEMLETQFKEYADELASAFAPELEFDREAFPEEGSPGEKLAWAQPRENNYWARAMLGDRSLQQGNFEEAREHFEFLREKGAATGERGGVLDALATCYREISEQELERSILEELLKVSSDALPGFERYIQMMRERSDWETVLSTAQRVLAVQPLAVAPHLAVSDACDQLGRKPEAVGSLQALLALDPVDEAGLQFRLADALAAGGQTEDAKEHLIDALLIAPRYRDAHRLLRELVNAPASEESEGDTGEDAEGDPGEEAESEDGVSDDAESKSKNAEPAPDGNETDPKGSAESGDSTSADEATESEETSE